MDALVAVRARIAHAVLARDGVVAAALGAVTLHPHQIEAVRRLGEALDEFGGALLADASGLGKTFVALAVARARGNTMVAAPAALRAQWTDAARRAGVAVRFVSLESLSRRGVKARDERLLIIDEAHHLRNRQAARYGRAAALALGRDVLLMTATPVHNRRADRDALLALFLGERAVTLADGDAARLIVRRAADAALVPAVAPVEWMRFRQACGIAAALRRLPPPLPAHDGRVAAALVRQGLVLAWSSSMAALGEMLRRAVHRAAAMDDAVRAGRWPTRAELRAWAIGDDASQLAFAALFDAPRAGDLPAARLQVQAHRRALDALRATCSAREAADTLARARWLERLMCRHDGECVVAFSRFEATVQALWRALRRLPGVVAISARGVRSAGGGIDRRELLRLLADSSPLDAAAPIRLVLATDLLGEGVDLRRASVIVHLDQPWTPALVAQREGRAARLGARHSRVAVYAVRQPPIAERLLALSQRLSRKRDQMQASVAPAEARETLIALVRPWAATHAGRTRAASVRGAKSGWLAVLRDEGGALHLLAARTGEAPREDDALATLLLRGVTGDGIPLEASVVRAVRRSVSEWSRGRHSTTLAGVTDESGRRRLLGRLDRGLSTASLHERVMLQQRAARLRTILREARGAGMERLLGSAPCGADARELLVWLEQATAHVTRVTPASPATARARVLALLVLV